VSSEAPEGKGWQTPSRILYIPQAQVEMSAWGSMLPGIAPIRQPASFAMSVAPVEVNTQQSHVTKSDITYRGLILSGWPTHVVLYDVIHVIHQ